jgi:hypothetical protein
MFGIGSGVPQLCFEGAKAILSNSSPAALLRNDPYEIRLWFRAEDSGTVTVLADGLSFHAEAVLPRALGTGCQSPV